MTASFHRVAALAILTAFAGAAHADFQIEATLPESVYDAVKDDPMLGNRTPQRFSGDGTRLFGAFEVGVDDQAFVWSEAEGVVLLGDLPGGRNDATPTAMTPDGALIVGRSWGGTSDDPFVWDDTNGMQLLEAPPAGYSRAIPLAISDDGDTVAGYLLKDTGPPEAFRWTSGGGFEPLGTLPGGSQSWATSLSADGAVVGGYGLVTGGREAFRWTSATGLVALGDLPGSNHWSQGQLVSDTGDAVAGYGWVQDTCDGQCSYAAQRAFRWTEAEGMVDLDSFTTFLPYSVPISMSGDATAIVGEASDDRHFLWREGLGNEQLEPLFAAESGTNADDWEIRPLQIVDDPDSTGIAILGVGRFLSDDPVVWRITLETPPACSDGLDNDDDGEVDWPDDPGCRDADANREDPQCDDDQDNDGDGGIDWDGGAGGGSADLQCSQPWRKFESPNTGCGLGPGLLLLLAPIGTALWRRRIRER